MKDDFTVIINKKHFLIKKSEFSKKFTQFFVGINPDAKSLTINNKDQRMNDAILKVFNFLRLYSQGDEKQWRSVINTINVLDLLLALSWDRLHNPELRTSSIEAITDGISRENYDKILEFAKLYKIQQIKDACKQFKESEVLKMEKKENKNNNGVYQNNVTIASTSVGQMLNFQNPSTSKAVNKSFSDGLQNLSSNHSQYRSSHYQYPDLSNVVGSLVFQQNMLVSALNHSIIMNDKHVQQQDKMIEQQDKMIEQQDKMIEQISKLVEKVVETKSSEEIYNENKKLNEQQTKRMEEFEQKCKQKINSIDQKNKQRIEQLEKRFRQKDKQTIVKREDVSFLIKKRPLQQPENESFPPEKRNKQQEDRII